MTELVTGGILGELPDSGLLDTSVFIAHETGRSLGKLPPRVAVSVMTIGELELGVLSAPDDTRARRSATLARARALDPFGLDEAVLSHWARLVFACRAAGVTRTIRLTDALIAATALAHDLPVVTQDADFDGLADLGTDLRVWKV